MMPASVTTMTLLSVVLKCPYLVLVRMKNLLQGRKIIPESSGLDSVVMVT
jgi:hypothetical protein